MHDKIEWMPLFLSGKTGRVYLQDSIYLVRQLINEYPNLKNPDAHLFLGLSKKPISGANVLNQIVKRVLKES